MLQMVRYNFLISIALILSRCTHLDIKGILIPTSDGVQVRFEQSSKMNEGLKATLIEAEENYIFYVATDPHIDKTSTNLRIFNDASRNDKEALFSVILGDCTDIRDNLPAYLDALAYSPEYHSNDHRIFHVLGNHDIFYDGWKCFKELIGPSVYWFEVVFPQGKDLYICLDTANGTLGRKQTEWFSEFLEKNRSEYRHCIMLTHTNLFYTDNSQTTSGNMPMEETYSLMELLARHEVSLVLQGHDHYREVLDYDDVRYVVVGAISEKSETPEYLKIEASSEGLALDFISF